MLMFAYIIGGVLFLVEHHAFLDESVKRFYEEEMTCGQCDVNGMLTELHKKYLPDHSLLAKALREVSFLVWLPLVVSYMLLRLMKYL